MKNKLQPSERNYNETEARFMVPLIAWLSLVMYNAITYLLQVRRECGFWPGGYLNIKRTDSLIATG